MDFWDALLSQSDSLAVLKVTLGPDAPSPSWCDGLRNGNGSSWVTLLALIPTFKISGRDGERFPKIAFPVLSSQIITGASLVKYLLDFCGVDELDPISTISLSISSTSLLASRRTRERVLDPRTFSDMAFLRCRLARSDSVIFGSPDRPDRECRRSLLRTSLRNSLNTALSKSWSSLVSCSMMYDSTVFFLLQKEKKFLKMYQIVPNIQ